MTTRKYYSSRTGKNPNAGKFNLETLKIMFKSLYSDLEVKGFFQEAFGYDCVDQGQVAGNLGWNIEGVILRKIKKTELWPISTQYAHYSEEDLFDVIEFLFDHVSKPIAGYYHSYGDCGHHYSEFDVAQGREFYLNEINDILADYDEGFELSQNGEILSLPNAGLAPLLTVQLPTIDEQNVNAKVENAILKFRRYRSSMEDRKDAIRDLADVLEYLRPQLKVVLNNKDEADLFNIVNNFAIRHHNASQQTNYDKTIWYSWMFHFFLATIHAATRLIEKSKP